MKKYISFFIILIVGLGFLGSCTIKGTAKINATTDPALYSPITKQLLGVTQTDIHPNIYQNFSKVWKAQDFDHQANFCFNPGVLSYVPYSNLHFKYSEKQHIFYLDNTQAYTYLADGATDKKLPNITHQCEVANSVISDAQKRKTIDLVPELFSYNGTDLGYVYLPTMSVNNGFAGYGVKGVFPVGDTCGQYGCVSATTPTPNTNPKQKGYALDFSKVDHKYASASIDAYVGDYDKIGTPRKHQWEAVSWITLIDESKGNHITGSYMVADFSSPKTDLSKGQIYFKPEFKTTLNPTIHALTKADSPQALVSGNLPNIIYTFKVAQGTLQITNIQYSTSQGKTDSVFYNNTTNIYH